MPHGHRITRLEADLTVACPQDRNLIWPSFVDVLVLEHDTSARTSARTWYWLRQRFMRYDGHRNQVLLHNDELVLRSHVAQKKSMKILTEKEKNLWRSHKEEYELKRLKNAHVK